MKAKQYPLPEWACRPIDSRMLGLYRIGYGVFMIYNIINYFRIDLIGNMFVKPKINFSYDYLGWIKPFPEPLMQVLLFVLLLCAIAICLGVYFKWAARIFALGYAYIFLIDKSIYNNHIYLFILLALLLSVTDADKRYSIKFRKNLRSVIPRWQVLILQWQLVIVYFYGGLAKLTKDWLVDCQPVKILVSQFSKENFLANIISSEVVVLILNYGGLIIDLGAPFFLLYKPLRRWAIFLFLGFNILNSIIFSDIGLFPFVMLASLFLFFEVGEIPWLNKLLQVNQNQIKSMKTKVVINEKIFSGIPVLKMYGLTIYFVFQIFFPFRGHFLPNDLDWTTIGNRFSWRMKVDTRKLNTMEFFINSTDFSKPAPVETQSFINDMQIKHLSMDPRSVADFAKFLKQEAILYNTTNPIVTANIKVAYNGRSEQNFVDPGIDLSQVTYTPFKTLEWVIPPVDIK